VNLTASVDLIGCPLCVLRFASLTASVDVTVVVSMCYGLQA